MTNHVYSNNTADAAVDKFTNDILQDRDLAISQGFIGKSKFPPSFLTHWFAIIGKIIILGDKGKMKASIIIVNFLAIGKKATVLLLVWGLQF